MHSVTVQPNQQTRFVSRSLAVKLVIAASLFALAYTQLSTELMVVLVLAAGLVLALMNRIDNINAADEDQHKRAAKPSSFDGGTYNRNRKIQSDENNAPVANDGGSFERSSMKPKHAA